MCFIRDNKTISIFFNVYNYFIFLELNYTINISLRIYKKKGVIHIVKIKYSWTPVYNCIIIA